MYYPPQPPPPQYPPQPYAPQYSGCLKFTFYGLSVVIPLAGLIIGIVYMSKGDPESKSLGRTCLIISIAVTVIGICIGVAFAVFPALLALIGGMGGSIS